MTERRYNEKEIEAIFRTAASQPEPRRVSRPAEQGLTLAELQAIGRDVGVSPDRIADAASEIDARREALPKRRDVGMPISVGRVAMLPRQLTDHEWDMLVGEFRRTFHAQGRDISHGNTRGWANGNLQICVEPAENAFRLRLATIKSDAIGFNRLGIGMALGGWGMAAFAAIGGGGDGILPATVALFGMGAGTLIYNALRLPRWVRERDTQFEDIVERVKRLVRSTDPV